MNTVLKKRYFEQSHRIILPENKGEQHNDLAATVSANFASIGFPMPTEMVKELSAASKEDIVGFYQEYYQILAEVIGADRNPQPFYPNFPEYCMGLTEADYFIDQIIYAFSGLEITPARYMEEKKRFPFVGTPMCHVMERGSEEDLNKMVWNTVLSPIAYSRAQVELIYDYLWEYPEQIGSLPSGKEQKNRENLVYLACIVTDITGTQSHLGKFLTMPNDVLRYAAVRSAQRDYERGKGNIIELEASSLIVRDEDTLHADPAETLQNVTQKLEKKDFFHYAALRYDNQHSPSMALSRTDRGVMVRLLENIAKDAESLRNDMYQNRTRWKLFVKNSHIVDYPDCKTVSDAFKSFSEIRSPERYEKQVEISIANQDVETAVSLSRKHPGDFVRRFDKLYRMAIEQGKDDLILDALKDTASVAGIATVMGLQGNIMTRDRDENIRIFKIPKSDTEWRSISKNRKAFTPEQIKNVKEACEKGLVQRFAGKEDMGKVYIHPSVERVKVPTNMRDASGSLNTITTGSRTPLPDKEIERFFLTWTNCEKDSRGYESCVDNDLSVMFFDKNGEYMGLVAWNSQHVDDCFVFSGDMRDGGPADGDGVAEYIDINRKKLMEKGVYFIIPQVMSFSGELFSEQPHTAFGIQMIDADDFGKPFEPKAVMNRFVLDAAAREYTPMTIDLEKNEMIWIGGKGNGQVASQNIGRAQRQGIYAAHSKALSIYPIILANVEANGELTDIHDAETIFVASKQDVMPDLEKEYPDVDFSSKKIIEANDMAYVEGYLLQDSPLQFSTQSLRCRAGSD